MGINILSSEYGFSVTGNWFKGEYIYARTYAINDVVTYNGAAYICIKSGTGFDPSNGQYWLAFGSGSVVTSPPDTTAPTPPEVSSSNVTENAVTLSWTASSDNVGVTGYDVYQDVTKLATVSGTQYNVTGLSSSTEYTFQVFAKDAAGNISTVSNIVTITTSAPVVTPPDDPSAITVQLAESSESFSSPMMGFRPARDVNITSFKTHEYATIYKHYIKYTDLEVNATDTYQKIKDWSNTAWVGIEAKNIKVVPRVVIVQPGSGEYFPNGISHTTVAEPWEASNTNTINRLVAMITKMGQAWDNDPRVAFIELGLYGKWGEHHIYPDKLSDGTTNIPLSFQTAMGNAAVAAFKNKKVTIRYADSFKNFDFGFYWDSFALPNDVVTGNGEIAKNNWRTQINSGEVAYNWGDQSNLGGSPDANLSIPLNVNYTIDWIMKTHTSSLGWIAEYSQTNPSVLAGATVMQKVLGYRFVLNQVTFTSSVSQGGKLNITFKVTNKGSSPFYYDYPVEACLLDGSGVVAWKGLFKTDIRNWLSGDNWNSTTDKYDTPPPVNTVNGSFTIPTSVANGTYTLALSILDPSGWNPSIRFANTNYYTGGRTPVGKVGIGVTPANQTLNTFASLKSDTTLGYSLTSSAYTGSIAGEIDGSTGATVLYSDSFSVSDNPSTLAGYTISSGGGTWGTIGGEAYSTSNIDGGIVLSAAINGLTTGDFTASCKMKGALVDGANSTRMNFIFKGTDQNNFLYVSPVAGNITLRKYDTGVSTQLGTTATVTLANGTYNTYKITYVASTGAINVYVDNVLKISYTLTSGERTKYASANKIGWRYNYIGTPVTVSRIDDLLVTTPSSVDTTPPIVSISPTAGTYTVTQNVTLSANETATIYYTTDGTAPTTASAVYSAPIPVGVTTTLRYFGRDTAGNESTVQSAVYTINAPPLFEDTFIRQNSTTTLGAFWTVTGGTWGIDTNEAYNVSDTDGSIITASTIGATNYSVTHVAKGCIATGSDSRRFNLIVRFIDSQNFILVSMVGGSMTLYKYDGGVGSALGSYVSQTTTNDVYYTTKAVCNGGNIKVYIDNILKIDYTMTAADITKFSGSTKVGWRYSKSGSPTTNARVDNFLVSTL